METTTKLGIWMDHSNAHLIGFAKESSLLKTISSTFNHDDKESALNKSESLMHNKRQQEQQAYYNKIGDAITDYEEVLLFGPTNAKTELLNIIKVDQRFNKIKIEAKTADKMTGNEQGAFVKKYFSLQ